MIIYITAIILNQANQLPMYQMLYPVEIRSALTSAAGRVIIIYPDHDDDAGGAGEDDDPSEATHHTQCF